MPASPTTTTTAANVPNLKKHEDVEAIQRQYDLLCAELNMDGKEATRILQERIKLLHEYNDVKDTTTFLLTHYAHKTSKTIAQVYKEFNVDGCDD
ncbi:hypothetical protein O0I10_003052 [Lichtheimia ornata]|uniref:DNA repair protein SWI5 homolog n=1 Tax=Lichtheimia ornata TaxID=688661 RepID=A0AAD7V956_9FUNG|nr:uncharacterized protein O0I10_003052 [Lichtheimia ornata]KAJ8661302.1 hypothetical protein O0I10_003052 [Lichtheimia ornata]